MNDLLRARRGSCRWRSCSPAAGTVLLPLPVSRTDDSTAALLPTAFTSVAAVCVTGLSVVDTATFWTPFGQGVILGLVQVAGFGMIDVCHAAGHRGRADARAHRALPYRLRERPRRGVVAQRSHAVSGFNGQILHRVGASHVGIPGDRDGGSGAGTW